jgi:dolichol-phosphate mannosyltransferase
VLNVGVPSAPPSINGVTGSLPEPKGAAAMRHAAVSVVVPTRNEAGNVAPLLDRLGPALAGRPAEVIFVDDSDDETPAHVRSSGERGPDGLTVRLIHREPGDRAGGLSTAVIAGMAAASGDWVVVMDGDLQHPPELVPRLLEAGSYGDSNLVVASRHVEGGESEGLGGPARVLVSGGATALAKALFPRRLHGITDPMSGFFAVRRSALDPAILRPDGFKILMEILVRTPRLNPVEVGFVFEDRVSGQSKASLAEGMRFARHLVRLFLSRLRPSGGTTRRVVGFGAVGVSGIVVNSAALWLLADESSLGINYLLGSVLATQVSTTWNFVLIDRVVYAGAKIHGPARRYFTFSATNNVLLLARIPLLALLVSGLGMHYLIANIFTLLITFVARFVTSDRLIYRMETAQ